VDQVGKIIETAFAGLPPISGLMGPSGGKALSLEERAKLEDADKKLGAWDQLRIGGSPTEMATYFTTAALYWRYYGDNERALERLERAVALDPRSVYAREKLGQTLSYLAADTSPGSPEKAKLLRRALSELEQAKKMQSPPRAETLHALAWTYDELGEYGRAAADYRDARARAPAHADAYTYNLARSLAKAGEFSEALRELEAIVNTGDFALWAENDHDFKKLRASSYGPVFAELIKKAKAQRGL